MQSFQKGEVELSVLFELPRVFVFVVEMEFKKFALKELRALLLSIY